MRSRFNLVGMIAPFWPGWRRSRPVRREITKADTANINRFSTCSRDRRVSRGSFAGQFLAVVPLRPGHFLCLDRLLGGVQFLMAVHAQQGEWTSAPDSTAQQAPP